MRKYAFRGNIVQYVLKNLAENDEVFSGDGIIGDLNIEKFKDLKIFTTKVTKDLKQLSVFKV